MKQKNHRGGYLSVLMCVLSVVLIISFQGVAMAGTLSRVEKMTDTEKTEIAAAEKKVIEAQKEAESVRSKIADAHKMKSEDWMEWRSWVEFDGDYILYRYQSHMTGYEFITQSLEGHGYWADKTAEVIPARLD